MVDYLIIGCGIAGVSFSELALQQNKTILVFDNNSQPSSKIAGGLYNPVVLKRFSEVWKASEQVDLAAPFYQSLEQKLNITFDFKMPIYRRLASVEEQNNWFSAADKPSLSRFLSTKLIQNTNAYIDAPFHFGEVFETGYLDVKTLVECYADFLKSNNMLSEENFDHNQIDIHDDFISYKGIKAKSIIFAEGFGLHANPYFKDLPLDGTKGELLHVRIPNLHLDEVVKSNIFILPIGDDVYKVGATYDWKDKTNVPTEDAKNELVLNLKDLINCDFEVIEHFAGVRPTVKDRRPLVGTHPEYKQLHILNGLGTRGVMLAPYLAKQLFNHLEYGTDLESEININRIYKKRAK